MYLCTLRTRISLSSASHSIYSSRTIVQMYVSFPTVQTWRPAQPTVSSTLPVDSQLLISARITWQFKWTQHQPAQRCEAGRKQILLTGLVLLLPRRLPDLNSRS